jgi:hypothetical protein
VAVNRAFARWRTHLAWRVEGQSALPI